MDQSSSRFQTPKTFDEEKECVISSVLKSTVYKNKWALQIFQEWQDQNALKICTIELGGLFKGEDILVWMCKSWLQALKSRIPKV